MLPQGQTLLLLYYGRLVGLDFASMN